MTPGVDAFQSMTNKASPHAPAKGRLAIVPQKVEPDESACLTLSKENQANIASSSGPSTYSKTSEVKQSQPSENNRDLINRIAMTRSSGPVNIDIGTINRLKVNDFEAFLGQRVKKKVADFDYMNTQSRIVHSTGLNKNHQSSMLQERTSSTLEKLMLLNNDVEKRSMVLKERVSALLKGKPKHEVTSRMNSLVKDMDSHSQNHSERLQRNCLKKIMLLKELQPTLSSKFKIITTNPTDKPEFHPSNPPTLSPTLEYGASKPVKKLFQSSPPKPKTSKKKLAIRPSSKPASSINAKLDTESPALPVRKHRRGSKSMKLCHPSEEYRTMKTSIPATTKNYESRDQSMSLKFDKVNKRPGCGTFDTGQSLRKCLIDLQKAHLGIKSALRQITQPQKVISRDQM